MIIGLSADIFDLGTEMSQIGHLFPVRRNEEEPMSIWFLRLSVIYFVLGVVFGMIIGISQKFEFSSVHAHINLLGWVSLALSGIIYRLFPVADRNVLSKVHFWLHNVGLPVMVVGLYLEVADVVDTPAIIATGGTVAIIGIIIFAINVLMNVKAQPAAGVAKDRTYTG